MAEAKPKWRGTLMLGLVSVPVQLFASTERKSQVPTGHNVHRGTRGDDGELKTCMTQAVMKKWCPVCDVEIPEDELMKGYDVPADLKEPGRAPFVELSDGEISALKVESTKVIRITRTADASELEPLMISDTSYLMSDGTPGALEAEAVLVEALRGKVAVGTLVMSGRERPVAVMVYRDGFVLHVLRTADAMRQLPQRGSLPVADPAMVQLATQLVDALAGPLDLEATKDEYAEGMKGLVRAKAAGEEMPVVELPTPQKVVSLMDALRASIQTATPAKIEPAPKAAAKAEKAPKRKKAS